MITALDLLSDFASKLACAFPKYSVSLLKIPYHNARDLFITELYRQFINYPSIRLTLWMKNPKMIK